MRSYSADDPGTSSALTDHISRTCRDSAASDTSRARLVANVPIPLRNAGIVGIAKTASYMGILILARKSPRHQRFSMYYEVGTDFSAGARELMESVGVYISCELRNDAVGELEVALVHTRGLDLLLQAE